MELWCLQALFAVNAVTFLLFAIDKWKARRRSWRIPEAHLLLAAACTGAPGGWLAMTLLRHKTQKTSFRLKMVAATLCNLVWLWLWWRWRTRG